MKTPKTSPAPKVGSSALVRRKCAAIYGPVPGTDGTKWVCIAVDGNLQWKTAAECDSEEDAKRWAKRTRDHWRKFADMQVCTRLAPNDEMREGERKTTADTTDQL